MKWLCPLALVLGCAGSRPTTPLAPDPEASAAASVDRPGAASDAARDTEVAAAAPADATSEERIDFSGPDAEPAPASTVVAPPQRDPLPSMLPGVLTGPR